MTTRKYTQAEVNALLYPEPAPVDRGPNLTDMIDPGTEPAEGMGAIFWMFWMLAFLADLGLLAGAGAWLRATGNPLAVVGLVVATVILALLLAAPVRIGRGRA